ncbi:MAG: DoxX family protein [Sphingobacteriales bacterium]|nr:DoxX family protein [Sphingobacteriales bacterium]
MKTSITIARVLVGLLFIFSGLVKANDPLGLSYKMQEFFEVWKLHGLDDWTLTLSVVMNAFEIIAGFALLLGWRIRLFSWLLLLLIVFFTFLTGYTYVTGMPKNCGCFGDCLPISSQTSFLKDLALTIMIAFLLWKRYEIRPLLPARAGNFLMLLIIAGSFGFQWYTLRNLPVVDCLPFKTGNNIMEKRKVAADAIPDSFAIRFIYTKAGKEYEFSPLELPADLNTYTFVSRKDKLIRKGNAEPAIKGFDLKGFSGADSTLPVLSLPYSILIFTENFSVPLSNWERAFAGVYKTARAKNIAVYMISGQPDQARAEMASTVFADLPVFTCDNTTIRSASRVNPTVYLLNEGVVLGKWAAPGFTKAQKIIAGLPVQTVPPVSVPVTTDSLQH